MSTLFDLTDRVCVVTGGTRGIGAATANRMLEHGARVVITGLDDGEPEARARELNDRFGADRALGLHFELSDRAQGRAVIDAALERWGRVDTLMCNAAHIILGRLEELDDDLDDFDRSFQSNVRGYAALTRHVLPAMRTQGGGSILYTLSTAGYIAAPPFLPYGVSKASLGYMTRSFAVDFGKDAITVNAIVPGSIRTHRGSGLETTGGADLFVRSIPLARRGDPDDIAGLAVLLASPAGSYITGQLIAVDGGMLLKGSEGITEGYDHTRAQIAAGRSSAPIAD